MRATISQRDVLKPTDHVERGLFFKKKVPDPNSFKPAIAVDVELLLSEEEKAILNQRQLWDTVLYTYSPGIRDVLGDAELWDRYYRSGKKLSYSIGEVVNSHPFTLTFLDPISAKDFANELESKILPTLKSYLVSASELSKPRTIEL